MTSLAELESLEAAWSGLLVQTPESTAFASPAWVLTWYRHFERPDGVYAVTVRRGDQLVGLAPFAQSGLGRRRAGFRLLVSAGTEHGDYGDPLLGADPGPVAEAISAHLAQLVSDESVVVNLRRLRDGSPVLRALERQEGVACQPMGLVAHAAVVRFDELDDPQDHLAKLARRHSIPRRMRRLREQHGEVVFRAHDPDVDGALDTMKDMLGRRWAEGTGPRLFATPALEAFTRTVVHALVEAGLARTSTLRAAGRSIAVSNLFQVGKRFLSDSAAYDPDLASFGIGQAELYETLRHCLVAGATEVDLRAGDFPYKQKWANAERISRSIVLTAPGRAGDVALAARRVAMSLRARRIRRWERRWPGE